MPMAGAEGPSVETGVETRWVVSGGIQIARQRDGDRRTGLRSLGKPMMDARACGTGHLWTLSLAETRGREGKKQVYNTRRQCACESHPQVPIPTSQGSTQFVPGREVGLSRAGKRADLNWRLAPSGSA